MNANFRGKGASLTNDFWRQKTRVPELSYGEKKLPKILNRLSRVHQRYSQTTNGRAMAYSERERKFTSAKKLQFIHTVNGDGSETAKIIKRQC